MGQKNTNTKMKDALKRARDVLKGIQQQDMCKTIWSSPAGKKNLADKLAGYLPPHTTYVEPFVGSAAVLFAKEPAQTEVINDADPEIVQAYRIIKRLNKQRIARLSKLKWVGDVTTYKRVLNSKPKGDVERLYKFLYISHFSYGRMRGSTMSPSAAGVKASTVSRIEKQAPRLKNVTVHGGDYERVIKKYDGPSTVFFLDPPYAGYDAHVGEGKFDEERFFQILKSIKGKFLLTYGIRGKLPRMLRKSKFHVQKIVRRRDFQNMRGSTGPKVLTQLLVSNYKLPSKTGTDKGKQNSAHSPKTKFSKTVPLVKNVNPDEERYVLGIVLEPETVDAHNEIYSAEEIRTAAHGFMADYRGIGVMHQFLVNGDVALLESYLAPTDFEIGGRRIKKGAWLIALRILSDGLWRQVKSGEFTGFSVGGSSRAVPEKTAGNQNKQRADA